jgi:hypothetical protein
MGIALYTVNTTAAVICAIVSGLGIRNRRANYGSFMDFGLLSMKRVSTTEMSHAKHKTTCYAGGVTIAY